MEYIKFTGKYEELKSKGFEFQRLFANNYMQWFKYGIRVWRRGGDITYDNMDIAGVMRVATDPMLHNKWTKGCLHVIKVYDKETREQTILPYPDNACLATEWLMSFAKGKTDKDRENTTEAYTAYIPKRVFDVMDELDWKFADIQ